MASNIFIVDADNKLTELTQQDYDSEALLQKLLADHPSLLSSATGADGGLLLVKREFSVPDALDGSARWSLDHLFGDRNSVPVLVEVKRASDTRARREVVAQMLDYAANGVAYWPVEVILAAFEVTCEKSYKNPDEVLQQFLGDGEADQFWKAVESNLKSGRIRMIFLADSIGKELRRIVEFLNEQMQNAEVLAVEVVQFVSPTGIRTLVPSLIGATARAEAVKSVALAPKPPISDEEWLDSLGEMKGTKAKAGALKMIEWMQVTRLSVTVTSSQDAMSAFLKMPDGRPIYPFFLRRSSGNFEVSLAYLKKSPSFESEASRLQLLVRIRDLVPRSKIWSVKATAWPSVPLDALLETDVWGPLERLLIEIVDSVRSA